MGLSPEMREFYCNSVNDAKSLPPSNDMMEMARRSAGLISLGAGRNKVDDDALQGCMAQLCYAATKFDPNRGVKWSTYAVTAVKHYFVEEYHRSRRPKRDCPNQMVGVYNKDGRNILTMRPCPKQSRPVDEAERQYLVDTMLKFVDELSSRERQIILWRFGIGRKRRSFSGIGDRFGITKQRVQQIERIALRKLRKRMEEVCSS